MDRVDARFFAPPAERGQWRRWTADEDARLREHYAAGGLKAALAVLPGRERGAVHSRAGRLGVRGPRFIPKAKGPRKYETSEAIDAAVRAVYESGPDRNAVVELARSLMRPADWVHRRAGQLGLVMPRYKQPDWSAAELELLERNAHKSVKQIQRIFLRAGFKRTANAIAIRMTRVGLDRTNPDLWSGNQLAKLMGVTSAAVARWVREAGLKARRKGTDANHDAYVIRRADLRRWIAAHAQHVDLRKVDRYWFIELMAGRIAER